MTRSWAYKQPRNRDPGWGELLRRTYGHILDPEGGPEMCVLESEARWKAAATQAVGRSQEAGKPLDRKGTWQWRGQVAEAWSADRTWWQGDGQTCMYVGCFGSSTGWTWYEVGVGGLKNHIMEPNLWWKTYVITFQKLSHPVQKSTYLFTLIEV